MVIARYFKQLICQWNNIVFTGIDIVAFIIDASGMNVVIPTWAYWVVGGIGLIIANIRLFYIQEEKILGFENKEANLIPVFSIPIVKHEIRPIIGKLSGSKPTGFNAVGIPETISISSAVDVINSGTKPGSLVTEIDKRKTCISDLFVHGRWFINVQEFPPEEKKRAWWVLELTVKETDPIIFAKEVKGLSDYSIVINYKTKRLVGCSKTHRITIKGDFNKFKEKLIGDWRYHAFSDLADLLESK